MSGIGTREQLPPFSFSFDAPVLETLDTMLHMSSFDWTQMPNSVVFSLGDSIGPVRAPTPMSVV